MAINLGEVKAKISGDTSEYTSALRAAEQKTKGFADHTSEAFKKVERSSKDLGSKVGNSLDAIGEKISTVNPRVGDMVRAFGQLRGAGLVSGVVAVGTAVGGIGVHVAKTAAEIDRLAKLSGTNTTEFQRFAAAADTVGMSQDQVADKLKDFREKVGEFLATGGGPMKDFFEQVAPQIGLTAEAFRGLSGPDALQLFYDSLKKAGVGSEELIWYMETMGSDTSKLIPLLADGGAKLKEFGDAASAAGRILDEETIRASKELELRLIDLQNAATGVANEIGGVIIPSLIDLADEFMSARKAGFGLLEAILALGTVDPTKAYSQHLSEAEKKLNHLQNAKWYEKSLVETVGGEELIEQQRKKVAYFRMMDSKTQAKDNRAALTGFDDQPVMEYGPQKKERLRREEERKRAGGVGGGGRSRSGRAGGSSRGGGGGGRSSKPSDSPSTWNPNLQNTAEDWENSELALMWAEADKAAEDYSREVEAAFSRTREGQEQAKQKQLEYIQTLYDTGRISKESYDEQRNAILQVNEEMSQLQQIGVTAAKDLADAFIDFAMGSDQSFSEFAASFLKKIAAMIIQVEIFNALQSAGKAMSGAGGFVGAIGSVLTQAFSKSANGNVFSPGMGGPAFVPFANGGVFDRPLAFPMAGGNMGLMAEAGPEAIMPLKRINGKLGIAAQGMGGQTVNNTSVTVNVESNGKENGDQMGQKIADQVIRAIARQEIANQQRVGGLLR